MDLIEHFGSYENAKAESKARHRSGIAPFELDRQLLEYRRQHNIYEHRDKVVYTKGNSSLLEVRLQPKTKKVLVRKFIKLDNYARGIKPLCEIRHATDAEIKAGHRLAEKEVL